jgi:hypothetical protein
MSARKTGLALKVRLGDTWQELDLDATGDESVASLKNRALAAQKRVAGAGYEVKFGGALVRDESATLASLGATDGSSFIVLARRRRPVR